MQISKLSGVAAAAGLLALPAAGLAAGSVRPANGTFTGTPHYTSRSTRASGNLTVRVARHRIAGVQLRATHPPVDGRHSHGNPCGAITDFTTKGHRATGTVSPAGAFHYTFVEAFKSGGKVLQTDTITLTGSFRSAAHATGTWRDVADFTAASAPGKAHCDSGTVKFSVTRR